MFAMHQRNRLRQRDGDRSDVVRTNFHFTSTTVVASHRNEMSRQVELILQEALWENILSEAPPTILELTAASEAILCDDRKGQTVRDMGLNLSSSEFRTLMDEALAIASDIGLVQRASANLTRLMNGPADAARPNATDFQRDEAGSPPAPAANLPPACPQWIELLRDHKCVICQDVLAGPVVLPCSHTFCANCIGTGESDIRVSRCPTCRQDFDPTKPTYVLQLDDSIVSAVNKAPLCHEKREWIARRAKFVAFKKVEERKKRTTSGGLMSWVEDAHKRQWDIALLVVTVALGLTVAGMRCHHHA